MIVLELTMPVMDGFAFLHRLREVPEHADIPVVVLSARTSPTPSATGFAMLTAC